MTPIGTGPSSVRPLHVLPPSIVRWTQPRVMLFPLTAPPPTHPVLSSTKNTAPSNTESIDGRQLHVPPPSRLSQYVIPDTRACRFGRRLNCRPNQPPSGSGTVIVQSVASAPPSVVRRAPFGLSKS